MITRMLAVALFVSLLAGCSTGKPETVPAGGKVTYKKTTPPVGALVVFHPVDAATEKRLGGKPYGKVGEDGTFTLSTYDEADGAPEGEYGVTIDWRGPPKDSKKGLSLGEEGGASGNPKLNPRYSNPQQPFTKVTVKKGDANQFSFEVE